MNKYKIILILLLAFKINTSYAQWGVDASFSPLNHYLVFKSDVENAFVGGQYTGFKIGYFNWVTEKGMNKISLQVNSIKNEQFSIYYDNSTFPYKDIKTNYSYEGTSYVFRYEGIGVHNEIDFKSHIFFKTAYLFGIKNAKFGITGTEKIEHNSQTSKFEDYRIDRLDNNLGGTSVILGIEYGLGYQYNITKFMGIYADASIGYIIPSLIYYDTNLGVRYRIK